MVFTSDKANNHAGLEQSYARIKKDHNIHKKENNKYKECEKAIPTVPESKQCRYTTAEVLMLKGIDTESLAAIDMVKRIFNGTVVSVSGESAS